MENGAINTQTQEEYNALMRWYEERGVRWLNAIRPTERRDRWLKYRDQTCVLLREETTLCYGRKFFFEETGTPVIPFTQFAKENGIEL